MSLTCKGKEGLAKKGSKFQVTVDTEELFGCQKGNLL